MIEMKNAYYRIGESTYSRSTSFRTGLSLRATEECLHLHSWKCHTLKFNGTHVLEVAFISVDCGQWGEIYKFSNIDTPTLHGQRTHVIVGILIDWLTLFGIETIQGGVTKCNGTQIRQIWTISPPYGYLQRRPWYTYRMRNCRIEGIQVEEDLWKTTPSNTYQWIQHHRFRRNKSLRYEQTEEKEDCPGRTCGNHRTSNRQFEWFWAWNSS